MSANSAAVLCLLGAMLSCVYCTTIPYPGLFNHGACAGDMELAGTSNPAVTFDLAVDCPFFGRVHRSATITDNGLISLGEPANSNNPTSFPVKTGAFVFRKAPLVAPYWSNTDLRCGGKVYYRVETSSMYVLSQYTALVVQAGFNSEFSPKSALIVTWKKVAPAYNSIGDCTSQTDNPRNTYQAIILTDELSTFVIFIYDKLEWDTGASRGPATAGCNAGNLVDGVNVFPTEKSATVMQVNLGQSIAVAAQLQADMMMAYAMEFGVAGIESYTELEDLPAIVQGTIDEYEQCEKPGATAQAANAPIFYANGLWAGDEILWGADSTSGIVYLENPIYFYGKEENRITVYVNGYISFDGFITLFYPPSLLNVERIDHPIVAPFYADGDARASDSYIYYRETTESFLRERAKNEILAAYPGSNFDPTTLFIATWSGSGFHSYHYDKRNIFQVVIASDDQTSYVIMLYRKIEWTSPDGSKDSNGNPVSDGVGAAPEYCPVIGLGDGQGHQDLLFGLPRSKWTDSDFFNLPTAMGNAAQGTYVFEASAAGPSSVKINSNTPYATKQHKALDPKTKYLLNHAEEQRRPSRPYVAKQWYDEINSLEKELKNHN